MAWSGNDAKIATTGAIDARIIDLVEEVGGFVPIANETSFPALNPDVNNGAGNIVSVSAIGTALARAQSRLPTELEQKYSNHYWYWHPGADVGFGMLVETTSTLHTYAFHRLTAPATNVNTVATNINSERRCYQYQQRC